MTGNFIKHSVADLSLFILTHGTDLIPAAQGWSISLQLLVSILPSQFLQKFVEEAGFLAAFLASPIGGYGVDRVRGLWHEAFFDDTSDER